MQDQDYHNEDDTIEAIELRGENTGYNSPFSDLVYSPQNNFNPQHNISFNPVINVSVDCSDHSQKTSKKKALSYTLDPSYGNSRQAKTNQTYSETFLLFALAIFGLLFLGWIGGVGND